MLVLNRPCVSGVRCSMPLLFDVAGEQAGEGVFEAAAAGEHVVQVFGDGHADVVLLGERVGVGVLALVDDGGHLLGLKRMDGCAAVAAYISPEKARTAALGQRGSGGYEKMINDGRTAFLCVDVLKGTLEGGLPIVIDGQVAGAVGVSGVKPNEDLEVAQAAVDAIVAGA